MFHPLNILLALAFGQVLLVLTPASSALRRVGLLRLSVTWLSLAASLISTLSLLLFATGVFADYGFSLLPNFGGFEFNGQTALMITLVSFIGWVTCRYSVRYLDGEAAQGRYFRWISFTIGCTSAMVLAGDMVTYCVLWCLTSLGLHQLLLHYPDRAAARRAAWTKFTVSRMGDAALLVAIALYVQLLPSLDFNALADSAVDASVTNSVGFQIATLALVLGVVAKSAQFPFHTWLPLTMETPTPVSALMHAGIVNAGGYLLVRSGTLLSASPVAQMLAVVIGTLTACLASIVMLTQTSIKKKLAYSTISQMGFMIMQCGLGAYSAAMLHILAHSLFKAHEFLSCGGVIVERAATQSAASLNRRPSWSVLSGTMVGLVIVSWSLLQAVGIDLTVKPGGWLLAVILCLAMTQWIGQAIATGRRMLVLRSTITAIVLIGCYSVAFKVVDGLVAVQTISSVALPSLVIVAVAFTGLFTLQVALISPTTQHTLRAWQIHAANGFYIESWLRSRLWKLSQ